MDVPSIESEICVGRRNAADRPGVSGLLNKGVIKDSISAILFNLIGCSSLFSVLQSQT